MSLASRDMDTTLKNSVPEIGHILGVDNDHHLIMIGVGNLGRALLNNFPFENTGFTVDASFDVSPDVIDTQINGIPVYSTDELESYIKRHAVDVVVLTIPQAVAQATANRLIDLGIRRLLELYQCGAVQPQSGCSV